MKSFRNMIVVCVAFAAILFVAGSSNASLITYSNFADWNSNVTNVSNEAILNPTAPATFQDLGSGNQSIEFGNATFSQTASYGAAEFYVIGSGFSSGLPTAPIVSSERTNSTDVTNIKIVFGYVVNGFALNFGTSNVLGTTNGSTVSFQLLNGSTSVDSFTKASTGGNYFNTTDFVGATDTAFDTVLITATDYTLNVNNVYDATPSSSSVPEPSTFAMLCIGGVGLAVRAFRRKKLAMK